MVQPQEWDAADRRIAIVLMRQAGHSFAEIGRSFGLSAQNAGTQYRKGAHNRVTRFRWFERVNEFNQQLRKREALRS